MSQLYEKCCRLFDFGPQKSFATATYRWLAKFQLICSSLAGTVEKQASMIITVDLTFELLLTLKPDNLQQQLAVLKAPLDLLEKVLPEIQDAPITGNDPIVTANVVDEDIQFCKAVIERIFEDRATGLKHKLTDVYANELKLGTCSTPIQLIYSIGQAALILVRNISTIPDWFDHLSRLNEAFNNAHNLAISRLKVNHQLDFSHIRFLAKGFQVGRTKGQALVQQFILTHDARMMCENGQVIQLTRGRVVLASMTSLMFAVFDVDQELSWILSDPDVTHVSQWFSQLKKLVTAPVATATVQYAIAPICGVLELKGGFKKKDKKMSLGNVVKDFTYMRSFEPFFYQFDHETLRIGLPVNIVIPLSELVVEANQGKPYSPEGNQLTSRKLIKCRKDDMVVRVDSNLLRCLNHFQADSQPCAPPPEICDSKISRDLQDILHGKSYEVSPTRTVEWLHSCSPLPLTPTHSTLSDHIAKFDPQELKLFFQQDPLLLRTLYTSIVTEQSIVICSSQPKHELHAIVKCLLRLWIMPWSHPLVAADASQLENLARYTLSRPCILLLSLPVQTHLYLYVQNCCRVWPHQELKAVVAFLDSNQVFVPRDFFDLQPIGPQCFAQPDSLWEWGQSFRMFWILKFLVPIKRRLKNSNDLKAFKVQLDQMKSATGDLQTLQAVSILTALRRDEQNAHAHLLAELHQDFIAELAKKGYPHWLQTKQPEEYSDAVGDILYKIVFVMEGNAQEYEELIQNLSPEFLCILLPLFCSRVVLGKEAHNKRIEEALKSRLSDPFVAQSFACWSNLDSKEESGLIKVFNQHKATDRGGDMNEKEVPVAGVVMPFLPGYQITSTQTVLHFKSKTKPAIVRVNARKLTQHPSNEKEERKSFLNSPPPAPRKLTAVTPTNKKKGDAAAVEPLHSPTSVGLEERRLGPEISTFRVAKWEDVRQDALILLCMRLFNAIWKRAGLKDVHCLAYNVLPFNKEMGCMEFIPDLIPLRDLGKYYVDPEARQRLCATTAASFVAGFVLGIGDRHDENIQIRRDGSLFHLDFGFIVGAAPGFDAGLVPMTKELWALLPEREFRELCGMAFGALCCSRAQVMRFVADVLHPYNQVCISSCKMSIEDFVHSRLGDDFEGRIELELKTRLKNLFHAISSLKG